VAGERESAQGRQGGSERCGGRERKTTKAPQIGDGLPQTSPQTNARTLAPASCFPSFPPRGAPSRGISSAIHPLLAFVRPLLTRYLTTPLSPAFLRTSPLQRVVSRALYQDEYERSLRDMGASSWEDADRRAAAAMLAE